MENVTNVAQPEANAVQMQQVDVSQGVPVPVEQRQTPVEEQTPPEGTQSTLTTPEELKGASERLKQQNARQAKVLASLGIDPLSDIGEQLESGLITPEMVVNHVVSRHQPVTNRNQLETPQTSNDPVDQAQAAYEAAKAACDAEGQQTGQISFDTMRQYNEAAFRLQDVKATSVTRQQAAERMVQQANENVERVLTVARKNDYYPTLPDKVKQISDFTHVAMTGALADQEAKRMGLNPATLTPQQYEYFASKATGQLGELAQVFVEIGRQQVLKGISPTNQMRTNQSFVPAGPGGTPVGLPNPFQGVNHTNHADAARQYMAGVRGPA